MKKTFFQVVVFVSSVVLVCTIFVLPSLSWAEGLKKIVSVMEFENKAAKSQWTKSFGEFDLGKGMADQLTDSLIQSGQFIVMERQDLGDVLAEQDLAASGRTQKSNSARRGKLTSAQILVKGVITELEVTASGGSTGFSFGGISIGSKKQVVHVALIIRLIDTTTSEVIDSQRVEGSAESGGIDFGLSLMGANFGTDSYKKTPIGKAIQMAMDDAVEYTAKRLRDLPYQGRVIKVKENVIYLSVSRKTGVSEGDVFAIHSKGEELVDPETGELLGSDLEYLGKAEVFNVQDKYSKAKITGVTGVKVGDIFRQESEF